MRKAGFVSTIRVVAAVLLLPTLLTAASGCQAFTFAALLLNEEPTKTIPAAYPYLVNQKVCILVRADMETLFEYPHLQWELADHVRLPLEANVKGITVVEPRPVVDFQRRDPSWETMDPAAIGKKFSADRVVEIALTQYATREPESPHLYRGYITATVNIYNTAYPESTAAYTTEVRTMFPPDGPGQLGTGDRDIRRATMEAFAQDLAGKFYDRKVKVK